MAFYKPIINGLLAGNSQLISHKEIPLKTLYYSYFYFEFGHDL